MKGLELTTSLEILAYPDDVFWLNDKVNASWAYSMQMTEPAYVNQWIWGTEESLRQTQRKQISTFALFESAPIQALHSRLPDSVQGCASSPFGGQAGGKGLSWKFCKLSDACVYRQFIHR